jgi:hypothetical protein
MSILTFGLLLAVMPLSLPQLSAETTVSASALSPTELTDLRYMSEEEKLARDVYLALYENWNLKIFANIAQSEQQHMDRILALLDSYGLPYPAADRGVFTDPALQELYTRLVDQGSGSIESALNVGKLIEELDISDLQAASSRTDKTDILAVFSNLEAGSRNHLNSFLRQLGN